MVLCLYRLHISDLSNTYMDTCKQQPLISSHLLNIVCICFRIASLINNLSSVSYKIYCLYIHLCYFLLFLGKSKSKNTSFVIWCSILAIFFLMYLYSKKYWKFTVIILLNDENALMGKHPIDRRIVTSNQK